MRKKSPALTFIWSSLIIALTVCLSATPLYALNYYNYGNNGSFLNVAAEYSNTDGSTVNATATPNNATTDLFFLNSTVGSSGALTFYTGNSSLRFNSMTFRSNVGSIQFDRNTMAAPTTTASILNSGGGITMNAGAGPVTWGSADQRVVLGAEADFTIANNSSSDLTFNREVQSVTNNTTRTITVAGSGSGNTIFYNIATQSNGRETAMTINTSGSGIVKFVGNNTYLGATTINAGTLQLGDGGTAGALAAGSAITNNGTLVFNRSNTVTQGTNFASVIAGTGNLTQAGSGTLILSGNNTYTGTTTVSAGTLSLGGNQSLGAIAGSGSISLSSYNLSAASASSTTFSGVMSGTGAFTKSGIGTLTVSGVNTYTGATTINGGTLSIESITNGGIAGALGNSTNAAGNLILGGGELAYTGSTASTDRAFTLAADTTSTINVTQSGTSLTISGAAASTTGSLAKAGAGTLILSGNNSYSGTTTISAGTLSLNNAALNNQTIQGNININGGALNLGAGHQIADSSNITLSSGTMAVANRTESINAMSMSGGNLTISTGVLTLGAAGSLSNFTGGVVTISGTNGRINTNGTTTLGNATFDYTNATTGTNGLALGGDIVVNANTTANFTISGGATTRIILMDANRVFDIGSGGNMNVGWRIRSVTDSLGALTKNGSGTLTLTASNPYGNGTTINDGTLVLGAATDTLANTGAVTINGGTLSLGANRDTVGVVTLAGGDITGTTGILTGAAYALQSGNVTAILGGTSIAATKTTAGTVILSGANTYTGATTINAGTLQIGDGFTSGSLSATTAITNNADLVFHRSDDFTVSNSITGTGNLSHSGVGRLTLTGNHTYDGTTTISLGTIEIGAAGRLGAGSYAGNISNNGTLIYSGTNAQTLSGSISGTGALTQNASSTLTLTGNNSYTGTTTIQAGTIRLQNTASNSQTIVGDITVSGGQLSLATTNQIADTASVTLTSGSIELSTYNETINSLTMSGGSLRRSTNTLALNSASSFTGGALNFASNTSRISTNGTSTLGDVTFDFSVASGTSTLGLQLGGNIAVNASTTANFTNSGGGLGRIDLNGADRTIDVGAGATVNVDWTIAGSGYGITKNGTGTLVLNANNTYTGGTVINSGTLEAAHAGALGSNNTVQVTGGTLLVTADDAINGKNIQMGGSGIGLQFSGNYSGAIGNLTLSANSIIDLGTGSVQILFQGLTSSNHTLSFYNWSGTTLWNGGNGTTDTDKVYFGPDLSDEALAKIYFHSGAVGVGDSFLGSGYDLGLQETSWDSGLDGYHIIPVPEPETYAAGLLLLLGGAWWMWRNRKSEACSHGTPLPCGVKGTTLK